MLILSLFIVAMASVSASDVSDNNHDQNSISINDDSVSVSENQNLDLSTVNEDSISTTSASDSSKTSSSSATDNSKVDSSSATDSSMASASSESDISKESSNSKSSTTKSKVLGKTGDSTTKNSTVIQKNSSKVAYGKDYSVTLKDKNGKVLSGKHVIFTFNGNNYTKTTDSNGIASLTLNAKAGNYIISVFFEGDDLYESSSLLNDKVTISKASTKIASSTKSAVKGKSYSVALKDQDGKALSSKKVIIKFNGKTYTKTTNSKGIVSFKITGQVAKTYKLSYKFAGDENYTASSGTESLKVKMPTYFSGSDSRIVKGRKFSVILKDSNKKVLSKKKVTVIYNGKTYNKTTNSKGVISFKINLAPKKTYDITYKYAGSSYYGASSKTVSVFVKTPTSIARSGTSVGKGKYFYLTLKDYKKNPLSKKTITIKYRGKTYKRTTNAKGVAKLKINTRIGTVAKLTYRYAGNKNYGSSSGSVNLRTKMATILKGSSSTIVKGNYYKITLKDGDGKAMAKRIITIKYRGKTYKKTTNAKGVVKLKINAAAGKTYKLSYKYAGTSYYNRSSSKTIKLAVKLKTTIKNSGNFVINNTSYVVSLKDSSGKALAGKTINFTFNNRYRTSTTDAEGNAHLLFISDAPMSFTLNYKFAGDKKYLASSGSVKFQIKSDKVFTFNQIVASAKKLRKYVEKNYKLPATVSVNGIPVNITSFAYLMAKSVNNLNSGKKINVDVVPVSPNYANNGNISLKANLYKADYINLTNKLISYTKSKHVIPNYIDTKVGRLSPNLYIFGLSKALDFYSTDSYLPNYIILDTEDVNGKPPATKRGNSAQYKKGLNQVQSLSASDLSKYLTASGNDAINTAIKTLANKLVSGKTTAWAKASAIFNYVRDNVKYEYYADTRYKASGTLSYKRGNCCDHANLIVALCRAAKIPARYSHAQGCRFSSGLVAGHVWAQIYVDGVWYSADATSSRNSLGNIQNWNTNSYSTLRQYIHLPF